MPKQYPWPLLQHATLNLLQLFGSTLIATVAPAEAVNMEPLLQHVTLPHVAQVLHSSHLLVPHVPSSS